MTGQPATHVEASRTSSIVANSNLPSQDWIATITIVRYEDVRASSKEAAEKLIARELVRNHGPEARITRIEKG